MSKHEKIVALRAHQTIDDAIREIHGKFAEALASDGRAFNARLAAGQMLIVLRERVEAGEVGDGVEWWPWYESKFVRSRRDAEKVMALVRKEDPEAAYEEDRAKARERDNARNAARSRRSDNDEEQPEDASNIPTPYDEEFAPEGIVDHAFRLVEAMDAEEQEQFIAKIRRYFKW